MHSLTTVDFLLRLATGVGCGALIGVERQWRARMAGLRTNALVATGATLFVLYSEAVGDTGSPTRVASCVVSGIGFLGGGVILRDGAGVRGLDTAATLWCSAAVGVLAASGKLGLAVLGTVAVLARPPGPAAGRASAGPGPGRRHRPGRACARHRARAVRAPYGDPHPGPAAAGPGGIRADTDRAARPPGGRGHHERAGHRRRPR
jgi:putative Mg2+ transporter-C (MgtC) family protein